MTASTTLRDAKLALTRDINTWIALYNGDPSDTGTEVTGANGLSRISMAATTAWTAIADDTTAPAGRAYKNSGNIISGTTSASVSVTHWAMFDADTAGNLLRYGDINTTPGTQLIRNWNQVGWLNGQLVIKEV